jgi:hypothetical protein
MRARRGRMPRQQLFMLLENLLPKLLIAKPASSPIHLFFV